MVHVPTKKGITIPQNLPENVGLFDSGAGGLSILKTLLPLHSSHFTYVADTAFLPYGQQTIETLQERGRVTTQLLLDQGIDTIIVACHTSSATTLPTLKKEFPQVTFIDMLAPTISKAHSLTVTNKIGVIATAATIASGVHKKISEELNQKVSVFTKACPKLVPLIEAASSSREMIITALEECLDPLLAEGADVLVLGCTHYAFLKEEIEMLAPKLQIVCAQSCAQEMFTLHPLSRSATTTFFVSGSVDEFQKTVARFLPELKNPDFKKF